MPDPDKLLATIHKATTLSRATPGRAGSIVALALDRVEDVLIVGDLHGHVEVLAAVIRAADLEKHPKRHLIVQELVHDNRIDPDEGQVDHSHRAIDLACALICQFPGRVHYLIGNHELSELTGRSISKQGHALNTLFRKGIETDHPARADSLLSAYHDFFGALPLMVRLPNRILACHTVPDELSHENIDRAVLTTGRWDEQSMKRGGTIYALTWSRDNAPETADWFAKWIDADLFVCGHQPCDEGYRQANHRTLILDGTDPNPAYALFSAHQPLTIEQLAASVRRVPMLT